MRLIDADELLEEIKDPSGQFFFNAIHMHSVESAQTIRCADCRYVGRYQKGLELRCEHPMHLVRSYTEADFACAYFERAAEAER